MKQFALRKMKYVLLISLVFVMFYVTPLQTQHTQARLCAWLEKGGVFSMKRLFGSTSYFTQQRFTCRNNRKCSTRWTGYTDSRALHLKWQGTYDMRDYEFQMHFCTAIYTPYHRFCAPSEIAFELRQVGTWLLPIKVNCRCHRAAELLNLYYPRPINATDLAIRPLYFKMVCRDHDVCPANNSPCYQEDVGYEGLLYSGEILCNCPEKYFCPMYYMKNHPREKVIGGNGRVSKYILRCAPRLM